MKKLPLVLLVLVMLTVWGISASATDTLSSATSRVTPPVQDVSSQIDSGDIVLFGHYPQSASGSDNTPVEWLVLKVDYRGQKALLMSKYGLDAKTFHQEASAVTWESCSLRDWLNIVFYGAAFSEDEKRLILKEDVTGLYDFLYLLTYEEAKAFFSDPGDGLVAAPTEYAVSRGAYRSDKHWTQEGKKAGQWWTRDTDPSSKSGYVVTRDGAKYRTKVNYTKTKNSKVDQKATVRPALWIDLTGLEE